VLSRYQTHFNTSNSLNSLIVIILRINNLTKSRMFFPFYLHTKVLQIRLVYRKENMFKILYKVQTCRKRQREHIIFSKVVFPSLEQGRQESYYWIPPLVFSRTKIIAKNNISAIQSQNFLVLKEEKNTEGKRRHLCSPDYKIKLGKSSMVWCGLVQRRLKRRKMCLPLKNSGRMKKKCFFEFIRGGKKLSLE
jgi:hypothetical protein